MIDRFIEGSATYFVTLYAYAAALAAEYPGRAIVLGAIAVLVFIRWRGLVRGL